MTSNTIAFPSFRILWSGVFALATDLLGTFRTAAADKTDEELVRDMHDGDPAAFERLYARYFDKIYAFVVRRVGHHQTAEDLVSDVFMKAFAHRGAFEWRASFSSWIYRIATNRVTDHHRTKKPTEELDEARHDRPSSVPKPQEEIDRDLLGVRLETVLERLTERERIAVTMKYYAECDNGEIGEALRVTANNVGVILHRALKKCGKLVESEGVGFDRE